jgi:hypothetical protein
MMIRNLGARKANLGALEKQACASSFKLPPARRWNHWRQSVV